MAHGKEPACQCRRLKRRRFNPWVRKIPWRRTWQPTPVFLPGRSHGPRNLVDSSPWGHKKSDPTEHTHRAPWLGKAPDVSESCLMTAWEHPSGGGSQAQEAQSASPGFGNGETVQQNRFFCLRAPRSQDKKGSSLTGLACVSSASPHLWLVELGNGQTSMGLV